MEFTSVLSVRNQKEEAIMQLRLFSELRPKPGTNCKTDGLKPHEKIRL